MKKQILYAFLLLTTQLSFSQGPAIEWEVNIGGLEWDECRTIDETFDGGFICAGFSQSGISGNKTVDTYGTYDYYLVKLDIFGQVAFEKSYGGEQRDQLYCAKQTFDGGFILGGWSESLESGNKTAPNYGNYDYYIFKLDAVGNLLWQNTIGGAGEDRLHAIIETEDGGYICGGTSESTDNDHTDILKGLEDYWVLRLDSEGNILWDKSYGGDLIDELFDIQMDQDGNYIFAGFTTTSANQDVTEPINGVQDGWAVKINDDGDILWQNTIGGSGGDRLEAAAVMSDGNYFLGSGSLSPVSGDQEEHSYDWDNWLKKVDGATGDIIWQVNVGGFDIDLPRTVIQSSDGSFLASGESTSSEGLEKFTPNYGNYDFWIVKLTCENPVIHYADADGDGYGDPLTTKNTCTNYPGYVLNDLDCDDLHATAFPGGTEICNDVDDDCDGTVDDDAASFFYLDDDGDGFGDPLISVFDCPGPAGYVLDATDCDDSDGDVYPGATEICNFFDDNCNADIDEGVELTFYADTDGDDYGDAGSTTLNCSAPTGYVADDTDCDDSDADIYPGATEICNELDDDCDADIDEGVMSTFYADADGDDYGDENVTILDCDAPTGYVNNDIDCDDSDAAVYPGAPEVTNGIDDDCDLLIDENVAIADPQAPFFELYPNPAQNMITIVNSGQNAAVKIIDSKGAVVSTFSLNQPEQTIDISMLATGIYFIVANGNNAIYLQKLVKE